MSPSAYDEVPSLAGTAPALALVICLACLILSMLIYFLNKIEALEHPRTDHFEELVPLKRYSYGEVKEITNSFSQEIGRRGFVIVYGGNLSDGLKVAVKILKESKKNGEVSETRYELPLFSLIKNGSQSSNVANTGSDTM